MAVISTRSMSPEEKIPLQQNEVHVWVIGPRPETLAPGVEAVLSKDEQARARRFKSPTYGNRWAFFRASMRNILARYTSKNPEVLKFNYGDKGKPHLNASSAHELPQFNLSHSGEYALLAVTHVAPVGIDIELMRPFDNMPDVAGRFFSPCEYQAWSELRSQLRTHGFYHCWTRKEAVIKALGLGLSAPLDALDVPVQPISNWMLPVVRPPLPQ